MNNKTNKKEKKVKPCRFCYKNNPPHATTCSYCHRPIATHNILVDPADYMDIEQEIKLRKKEQKAIYKILYYIIGNPQHKKPTTKEHIQKRKKQEQKAIKEYNTKNPPPTIQHNLTLQQIQHNHHQKQQKKQKWIQQNTTTKHHHQKEYETKREAYIQKQINPPKKYHNIDLVEILCYIIYFSPWIIPFINIQLAYDLWWFNYVVCYGLFFGVIYYYLSLISPLKHRYTTIIIPITYGLLTHDLYTVAIYWFIRMITLFF